MNFEGFVRSHLSIYENWDRSFDQVESVKSLGNLPLFVLTACVSAGQMGDQKYDVQAVGAAWFAMHKRYSRLSSAGVHRTVPGARHVIQDERPDVLVETIAEAIAASSAQTP